MLSSEASPAEPPSRQGRRRLVRVGSEDEAGAGGSMTMAHRAWGASGPLAAGAWGGARAERCADVAVLLALCSRVRAACRQTSLSVGESSRLFAGYPAPRDAGRLSSDGPWDRHRGREATDRHRGLDRGQAYGTSRGMTMRPVERCRALSARS